MSSVNIKSLAQEVGEKGLDYVKQGAEIPLKVTGSGIEDDYVVKVEAEGSNPDFSETVGVLSPGDLGNVSKRFSVPFDFPGGEDVNFTARVNTKDQSNVYVSGSTSTTEKIYSEADEKIKEILNKAKDTMNGDNSSSSGGTDTKNKVKNLVKSPALIIPVIAVAGIGLSAMGGGD